MQTGPLTFMAALKAAWWSRLEGKGSYTQNAPRMHIAVDNGFQEDAIDSAGSNASNGNVVHSFIKADSFGRFSANNPNGTIIAGAVGAPAAPTVTPNTAGAITWTYAVVYRYASGATSPASAGGSTTTSVATLTSAIFNTISGVAPVGVAFIDIYRTTAGTTPSTTGQIGTIVCSTLTASGAWSFNDTALAGDGTTAPSADTTGALDISNGVFDFVVNQLTLPVILTAIVNGTAGTTHNSYMVVAVTRAGNMAASAVGVVTTCNATLTAANSVTPIWKAVPGALTYNVYRTASGGTPSTTGLIGTVLATGGPVNTLSFTDTGIAGTGTAPAASSNTTGSVSVPGGGVGFSNYASVNLSAAQIISMGSSPVPILASPGSGKAIIVQQILFEMTTTSTGFTGGTAVSFLYHGGSVPVHAGSIPAATITAGAGTTNTLLGPAVQANGTVVPAATGIDIAPASTAFAAGTGTAKVQIWYNVVTL